MITIEAHICKQRRSYTVKFPTGAMAVAWMTARQDTHAFDTDSDDEAVVNFLNPTCEHGLSAHLCYGPQHYASDREISEGW